MTQKYVLVTGWLWFIGSHTVVALEQLWIKTIILDNLSNSAYSNEQKILDNIQHILWYTPVCIRWDIRDKECLNTLFTKYTCDAVIHFAAQKSVSQSCSHVWQYLDNNINGSITLCNTMLEHGVRQCIFSSSCTVYWAPQYIPVDEKHPLWTTTNPYGTSKQVMEQLLQDYSTFGKMHVIALRYFNPLGAHPSGFLGEEPAWTPENIFPYILNVLRWKSEYLRVFWDDYPTRDWTWVRDYINVCDLAQAHVHAYQKLQKNWDWHGFDAINIGVWTWVSVLELIHAVEKVSWKKVPYKVETRRPWDIAEVYADATYALETLKRKATTSLEDSIRQALEFYGLEIV